MKYQYPLQAGDIEKTKSAIGMEELMVMGIDGGQEGKLYGLQSTDL
jgi:hypothetical protein